MPIKAVFETALTQIWTALEGEKIGDKPGDIRWERDSGGMKAYKCVIFSLDGAVTVLAGDVCYYEDVTGYPAHTVTADASASTGQEMGAGVFLATVLLDLTRCWVQIRGFATVLQTIAVAGDGDPLTTTAAADKVLTRAVEGAGVLDCVCAWTVDVSEKEIICQFPF